MEKVLLGFAASVMTAASIWSLLLPSIEDAAALGRFAFLPAAGGFAVGFALLGALGRYLPEPTGAAAMLALTGILQPLLPWCLAFAAGAMLFVVAEQLLPEIGGKKAAPGLSAFAAGFLVMMILDVALG